MRVPVLRSWTAAPRRPAALGRTRGAASVALLAFLTLTVGVTTVGAEPPPTLGEVQAQVDVLHEQAVAADERYNTAADQLVEVQRRLDSAQVQVSREEQRVREVSAALGAFAAMSYRSGGIDPTIQTLLADDPERFLASASTVEAYAGQQAEQLAVVAKARQQLAETRAAAEDELAQQTRLQQTLATEKATFDGLLAEQEALLAELTREEQARLAAEQERQQAAAQASRDQARAALNPQPDAAVEQPTVGAGVPASGRAAVAVEAALSKVGNPYSYGAAGPGAFDCSGLMLWAWGQAGVSLPRSSGGQAGLPNKVGVDELQPGDILYYDSPVSHVAMYIGGGQVVHAANPRTDVNIADAMGAGGSAKPYRGAVRPG